MRTTISYLDENKKPTTAANAYTVVKHVYDDKDTLLKSEYLHGPAFNREKKAEEYRPEVLVLKQLDNNNVMRFSKPTVNAGREKTCDIQVVPKVDKKKIDKIHAVFTYKNEKWYIKDTSSAGVWVNGTKIEKDVETLLSRGDIIDFAQKQKMKYL